LEAVLTIEEIRAEFDGLARRARVLERADPQHRLREQRRAFVAEIEAFKQRIGDEHPDKFEEFKVIEQLLKDNGDVF
jgi:hypothetical protein